MSRAFVFAFATVVTALQVPAQTTEQIVQQHLQAMGGTQALTAIKTLRFSGKLTAGPGMEMPMTLEFKSPGRVRTDTEAGGQAIIQVNNGKDSWLQNPMMGSTDPMPMPEDMLDMMADQGTQMVDPLLQYKERGAALEPAGKETGAILLKLTEKNGHEHILSIDSGSHLITRITRKVSFHGQPVNLMIKMSGYKAVNGVQFAHALDVTMEGTPIDQQITIDKVEINVPVDDARFLMPKKPAAAAPAAKP